jgi:hypothetical protein
MSRYDDTFVDRFLEPWKRHDVGALALMTDVTYNPLTDACRESGGLKWAGILHQPA